ncbi:MAG: AtpZ/AtpI family protein [Phototrophicaceae bacterium]
MQITCPQCSKQLTEHHIDIFANVVSCDACNAVFSTPSSNLDYVAKKDKKPPTIPKRFKIDQHANHFSIAYRENACAGIASGLFALFWNGLLWVFFVPAFGSVGYQSLTNSDGIEWLGLLFPIFLIPFLLIGFFIGIYSLKLLLNTVTIQAHKETLSIKHRPIRLPSDKSINTKEISQLYTKQHITQGSGADHITYELHAVIKDGKEKTLLDGLTDAHAVLFIEYELEKFLRIRDRRVDGEYRA